MSNPQIQQHQEALVQAVTEARTIAAMMRDREARMYRCSATESMQNFLNACLSSNFIPMGAPQWNPHDSTWTLWYWAKKE